MNEADILKLLALPGARIERDPVFDDHHRFIVNYGDVLPEQLEELRSKELIQPATKGPGGSHDWVPTSNAFTPPSDVPAPRKKSGSYVGAPAIFILELACKQLNEAYRHCEHAFTYQVGSSLERPDWRDVDLRMIMSDDDFKREFPRADLDGGFQLDTKWLLLTTSISGHLSKLSGLPIDFQFQPMTHANARHKGRRNAMGMNGTRD